MTLPFHSQVLIQGQWWYVHTKSRFMKVHSSFTYNSPKPGTIYLLIKRGMDKKMLYRYSVIPPLSKSSLSVVSVTAVNHGPEAHWCISRGSVDGLTLSPYLQHSPHFNSSCRHFITSCHHKKKGENSTMRYFETARTITFT